MEDTDEQRYEQLIAFKYFLFASITSSLQSAVLAGLAVGSIVFTFVILLSWLFK